MQFSMVPRRATQILPLPTKTASARGCVIADNGLEFIVKGDGEGSNGRLGPLRANEWIGHALADIVGIPVPTISEIKLDMGGANESLFGSQKLGGRLTDDTEILQVLSGHIRPVDAEQIFSKIFAFDLMIGNVDRHSGNYMFQKNGNNLHIFAYDFGWSLFDDTWPPAAAPMRSVSKTRLVYRAISRVYPFDRKAADAVMDSLVGIGPTRLKGCLDSLPNGWLQRQRHKQFIEWYSAEMRGRAAAIRKELDNGTLI